MEQPRAGSARQVPVGIKVFRNIALLATLDDDYREIRNAAIIVKGNEIVYVGPDGEIPDELRTNADQTMDLSNHLALPGLVSTHAHMFQALTRCLAQSQQLHGWLKSLYPVWAQLTPEDLHTATQLSMAELILSGATTASDHLYIYPNGCLLDDTIRAAREIGLRFHAVRGSMSAGVSKGGIAPDSVVEDEEAILRDCERCIREFHDMSRFSMLHIALGPSSQKTVTDSLMSATAELARRHEGVRLHTHLAENREDITLMAKVYGEGHKFGDYIKSVGWDKGDCWFAHCCMLSPEEISLFAERGIGVAHCPSSNTRLASGIAPVREMLDAGVNVGLGIDGGASNDTQHILAEARLAMLLQRSGRNPRAMSAREVLRLATRGGAINLGRQGEIGQIAPGYAADFVAWNMEGNLAFVGAEADPLAALVLCAPSAGFVSLSVINGEVVVEGGKLKTVDLPALMRRANEASRRLTRGVSAEAVGAGGYRMAG